MTTTKMGWAEDDLGYRGARRVTFTMPRSEYDRAPFHTKAPSREGWEPYWIAKHTDIVRWTYRPIISKEEE